jgi:branched-subunit amino acid ABC-type transport system permease component
MTRRRVHRGRRLVAGADHRRHQRAGPAHRHRQPRRAHDELVPFALRQAHAIAEQPRDLVATMRPAASGGSKASTILTISGCAGELPLSGARVPVVQLCWRLGGGRRLGAREGELVSCLATALFSEASLRFVLLGTATGALTALVALGIVIVYRASGVLNFSAGAMGGIAAYYCYDLRDTMATPVAVAMGVVAGVLLGLLTYGVLALLRDASQLARLIATLGLFGAGQAFMVLRWGPAIVQPRPMLPSRNVTLFGDVMIGLDRLLLIGIALACAVVLRFVYSGTLFGLATSAVAESRRVAASAGWSPSQIELVNFAVAGGLSALAAILLAPIVTLNAAVLSIAVIPALAAALVGRFSSFGVTVAAALVIGIIQSEISLFQPDIADALGVSAASLTGLVQAVPLAIILGYMIVTGRSRLQRGETVALLPLPGSGSVSLLPLVVGTAVGVALLFGVDTWTSALIVDFRHRHHPRLGRRRRRLRRSAVVVPVRPGRVRGVGRGAARVGQRLALRAGAPQRHRRDDPRRPRRGPACGPHARHQHRRGDPRHGADVQLADLHQQRSDRRRPWPADR